MKQIGWAAVALWILSGVYLVPPDQQAVETRFGRVATARVMPGLHYALPWPLGSVKKLKVRQLQRLAIGGELLDAALGRSPAAQFLTGDQNIISLRVVVQFSVGVPADYLFQAEDPARIVAAVVESEMSRRVGRRAVDEVLTTGKIALQEETQAAGQRELDRYRAGVQLSSVNIESVAPPPEAAPAFRDVAGARADTARIISNAQGYANDIIPKARGEAQKLIEESQGYKQRRINEASGDAARFNQSEAEYAKAGEVTRQRLYAEAMEQVLPRIKKVVTDPNGNFDLTIIRKWEPAAK